MISGRRGGGVCLEVEIVIVGKLNGGWWKRNNALQDMLLEENNRLQGWNSDAASTLHTRSKSFQKEHASEKVFVFHAGTLFISSYDNRRQCSSEINS